MTEWIDITRVLVNGLAGWPGDPPLRLTPVGQIQSDGARVTEISMSAHIGTHLDAPAHCLAEGDDVASIALGRLCGPAVLIDAVGSDQVTPQDLQASGILGGDRVLLRVLKEHTPTAWTPISVEAARWLFESGVAAVGVDSPSPEPPRAHDLPVHRVLLSAGIPILENLDLSRAEPGRYEMIALPLPIQGCEASPARVILRRLGE